jgi:glycosyl-4,4'-diaponeurosporenoate acyltransferase
MFFHLPTLITVAIDIITWFIIHLGVSYFFTRKPLREFNADSWFYRTRKWENEGTIYENFFGVKRWKHRLPDGAAIFKMGFEKKELKGVDREYLDKFIRDTCRAELIHWVIVLFSPLFFIWNLWWVGLVMIAYATLVNMPCVISQRYNRIRLKRLLAKRTTSLDNV